MVFPPKASWDHRPSHPTSGKTSLTTFFQAGYQLLAHGTNLGWQEEKETRFFGGSSDMLCQLPNGSKWLKKDAKHFACPMKKRENTRSHVHISYIMYIYIYCIYSDWYNPMIPSCNISYNMCYSIMSEHWPKKHVFFLHFESPDLPNLGHNEFLQLGAHAGQIFGWSLPGCNRARWKLW